MATTSVPNLKFTVPESASRSSFSPPEFVTDPPVTEALPSTLPEAPTKTSLTFVPTVSKKRSDEVFFAFVRLNEKSPIFFRKRIYKVPVSPEETLSPKRRAKSSELTESHFQLEPGSFVASTSQAVRVSFLISHSPVSLT